MGHPIVTEASMWDVAVGEGEGWSRSSEKTKSGMTMAVGEG